MKAKIRNILTFVIGWPLSFLALFFIIKSFLPDSQNIIRNLEQINIALLLSGIVCFLFYYGIRSVIWHRIVQLSGNTVPPEKSPFLWATSEFKRYIPGNIWSFLGRAMLFEEHGVSKKDTGRGLVIELQIVLLGSIIASIMSVPFLKRYIFPFLADIPFVYPIIIGVLTAVLLVYVYQSQLQKHLTEKIRTIVSHVLPHYAPFETFRLLALSTLSFIFFGLGYYFAISSFILLHPQDMWTLTGFFVFSLIIGLLSFITPTGLGVREGMISLGLSQIIAVSAASFASLFARVVLVMSEVLFLLLTYALSKLKKQTAKRAFAFIRTYAHEIVLAGGIVLFWVYFTVISFLRHDNFFTGRFDLGNMDQTVWNTIHGRIFMFTNPDGTEIVSRMAFHADVLLVLLSPLYLLWESPKMLLLVQTIVVGAGAIFVYLLAKDILKHKILALVLAFSYLLNPSVQRATIYDFHAVTLATTFLLGAFYFMRKKRYVLFVTFLILAGISKEQIWFVTALLGGYLSVVTVFQHKHSFKAVLKATPFLLGLGVFIASAGLFYYTIWHAIPNAGNSTQHFALAYFSEENSSPSALIKNAIFSPGETWNKVTQKSRKDYVRKLLLPVGYMPLAAPWYLLFPSADLGLNLLSDKGELHQIYYQYTAAITPFLFIAAMYGIKNIRKLFPTLPMSIFATYMLIIALYGAYRFGPLPGSREPNLAMLLMQKPDREFISEQLNAIDPRYKVAASNSLGAQVAHREYLYTIPYGVDVADVIIFNMRDTFAQPSLQWHKDKIAELRQDPDFEVMTEKNDLIIFRRK